MKMIHDAARSGVIGGQLLRLDQLPDLAFFLFALTNQRHRFW